MTLPSIGLTCPHLSIHYTRDVLDSSACLFGQAKLEAGRRGLSRNVRSDEKERGAVGPIDVGREQQS